MYPSLTRFPADLFTDFEGLQRQVEQLLAPPGWPSSIRAASRGAFPAINVGITDEAVEVYAFVPGVDPARVEVSVDKGLLTIAGERPGDMRPESEKVSVYAQERFTGAFRRVISLPEDADHTSVEASYRNGVLKIVVPKRAASRPRRVEIQG
ncbi:MAG: Hsp20/alpha crystallin family protein [Usitatibacter sp.]